MPITKMPGRQDTLVATADFTYADLASGQYAPAVNVPAGAIVTGGGLSVTEAFNSATTDKFSIGIKDGAANASSTALAAQSADFTTGYVPIVPTGAKFAATGTVGIQWDGAGTAPTAGAGRLVVEYIIEGRAHSSEG